MRRLLLVVTIILLVATSGCGTIQNMNSSRAAGGRRPMGGALNSLVIAMMGPWWAAPFALADLPLSIAGDLVTLPWLLNQP